jgi:hypothetical protein
MENNLNRTAPIIKTHKDQEHRDRQLQRLVKKNPLWEELFKDYEFDIKLGEGSFGQVIRAKDR